MDWQIKFFGNEVYIVDPNDHSKLVVIEDYDGQIIFFEDRYDEAKASGCPREILKQVYDYHERLINPILN